MQSMPNNRKRISFFFFHLLVNTHSLIFILVYYPINNEYELIMNNKYQSFHDSGIVDEGLSDETGSIEEEFNNQENQLG